jgi:hypothetical protein
MEKLQHAAVDPIRHQQRGAAGNTSMALATAPPIPAMAPLSGLRMANTKASGAGGVPCHRLID